MKFGQWRNTHFGGRKKDMADIVDIGNDRVEEITSDAIAAARRGPMGAPGIGVCINCGDPVEHAGRWCSIVCRDDYQRTHRVK